MFLFIDNKKVEYPYPVSMLKCHYYTIPVDYETHTIPSKSYRKYVFSIHNQSLSDLIELNADFARLRNTYTEPDDVMCVENMVETITDEDSRDTSEMTEQARPETRRKNNVSFLCDPTVFYVGDEGEDKDTPKNTNSPTTPSNKKPATTSKFTTYTPIHSSTRNLTSTTKSTTTTLRKPTVVSSQLKFTPKLPHPSKSVMPPVSHTVSKIIRTTIQCPIETLSDLISLAKRAYVHPKDAILDEELVKALEDPAPKEPLPMYPISPYVKYNIDLELLYRLLPEMENLESMVGQTKLKVQVANMILYNAMGLDKRGEKDLLHTVIYGSPGTGKTEFAQRIAKIYLKMGVLRKNIFKKVKRSDLIAGYLGQTAIKTMEVIEEVRGGVLFIDEAYSLGSSQGKEGRDSFSKECVDTLNQCLTEMRDKPEHYFILIIAGYKDDLERSFFALNDGLERRFTVHLTMDEYKPDDMVEIFKKKVRDAQWAVAENVVTSDFMKNNAEYFKYAGGDMEVLFSKCKVAHSRNLLKGATKTKFELSLCDLNDGFAIYKSICGRAVETNDSDAFWKSMYN